MERKKEQAINLVKIENVFIAVEDETNLDLLFDLLDDGSRRFITTKHSRHVVQSRIKNFSNLLGVDQYNGFFGSEFESLGQSIFIGTMYEKFKAADQAPFGTNKIKAPIDLVVVNFGDKKFQDLNRDEQASLFILQAAMNNFGRVLVLSNPDEYKIFAEYFNRAGEYFTNSEEKPRPYAGTTEMKFRFRLAREAGVNIAALFSDFSNSKPSEQKWVPMKAISLQNV